MSVLSFCVECVNHNEIPLEAIAKFFHGQRVGNVNWIDVVEYVEVTVCGAKPQENYRRLYVHFEKETDLLERSELFKQELMYGHNGWKLAEGLQESPIRISVNKNASHTKHDRNNETTYAFNISMDFWPGTYDKTKRWNIYEILGELGVTYKNLHKDNYNIFQYIEDSSFQDPEIAQENLEEGEIVTEEEERRVDMWNPDFDFHNKYTTWSGAVGFRKDDFKEFYGKVWEHYWNDSMAWEQYYPVLHGCMTLNLSITLGPFFPPHSYVMNYLITPIENKMMKIEDISYYYAEKQNYDWVCEMEMGRSSYFIANMNIDFTYLTMDDFYTIKNTLLHIEQICEVLKPKDIYNSMPESRIYINFE